MQWTLGGRTTSWARTAIYSLGVTMPNRTLARQAGVLLPPAWPCVLQTMDSDFRHMFCCVMNGDKQQRSQFHLRQARRDELRIRPVPSATPKLPPPLIHVPQTTAEIW